MNKKEFFSMCKKFIILAFFIFLPISVDAAGYSNLQYENRYDGKWYLMSQKLTKDKSPYLVQGGCVVSVVPEYATLTIEPGVVIKFESDKYCVMSRTWTGITIRGNFIANGTENDPIIFTSFKDDDSGGDSNGDGASTQAKPGDWKAVELIPANGNNISISHSVFKYGGVNYGELWASGRGLGSSIFLDNIDFSYSGSFGVYSQIPLSISKSKFRNNVSGAINTNYLYNPLITAINNWWGDDSGPAVSSNPSGRGENIFGNVLYDPWIGKETNIAPVLSFSNDYIYGVDPRVQYLPEQPKFKVIYFDENGDAPVFVNLVVGSSTFPMTLSKSLQSGFEYTFTPATGTFQKADFNFYFEASDGPKKTRLPLEGELNFKIKNRPVVLIPGIAGTELVNNNDLMWLNLEKMLFDIGDDFLDAMEMDENGLSKNNIVAKDVLRVKEFLPRISYKYFGGLIIDLVNNGFVENDDLFVFPYDWRLDNKINAENLKEKISNIIKETDCSKVNIVAHSMGGLVAKQYINNNGPENVDKLVFVGTPHLGSPNAFKTLLEGDDFGIPFLSSVEIKKLARNMSTVYQLLPTRKYVERFGGYFVNNGVLSGFDLTTEYLKESGLNQNLLKRSEIFHEEELDDFRADGVDVYNIIGCNSPTLSTVIKKSFVEEGSVKTDYDLRLSGGDGTVPLFSAMSVSAPNDHRFYVVNSNHSKMPSEDGTRQAIIQIILGKSDSVLPENVKREVVGCFVKGKMISVHSPVELNVIDSNGNHTGPEIGYFEKGIPGSNYFEFGGDKFVFLPEDLANGYQVRVNALANGKFSMKVAEINEDIVSTTTLFSDVVISDKSLGSLILDVNKNYTIRLDYFGDGKVVDLKPSSILNDKESEDVTKPLTKVVVNGIKGDNDWYVSPVEIRLSATDDNSGILLTEYSLDDGKNWLEYKDVVNIVNQGENNIIFRSIDRAGNKEDVKKLSLKIDTILPEFSISFDLLKKEIILSDNENANTQSVTDGAGNIVTKDLAGNSTKLSYEIKNEGNNFRFIVKSLAYNGIERAVFNDMVADYKKITDKSGEIIQFKQSVKIDGEMVAKADYNKITETTKYRFSENNVKEVLGIRMFSISTNNGKILINY